MWSLVRIELFKVFRKPRTYIAFAAVMAIVGLIQLGFYVDGKNYLSFGMQSLSESFDVEGKILNGYLMGYIILQTLLVHVPLLIALVAGDMISGEANMGTLRLLVSRPRSRQGLLMGKFIASCIYTVALLLWMAVWALGVSVLLFGADDMLILKSEVVTQVLRSDVLWRYVAAFGFATLSMITVAALAFLLSLVLPADLGRMKSKPGFSSLFSRSEGINVLSLARFFLFGARDVWFVVALPVFLEASLGWRFWEVGAFMGLWVIGYGLVQASTPALRRAWGQDGPPGPRAVSFWAAVLSAIPALIALSLMRQVGHPGLAVVIGLAAFGVVFAINSAIHSAMVLLYSDGEGVSLNVGFYYMANAGGRLLGTLLSGWVSLQGGLQACLWCSAALVGLSWLSSLRLPPLKQPVPPHLG